MFSKEITEKLDNFFVPYPKHLFSEKQFLPYTFDTKQYVYSIQEGFVRVYRISEEGDELTLMILKPGDFFPMTYGLNQIPNIYFLQALSTVTTYRTPQDAFTSFLTANPDVFFELSSHLMDRFDGLLARLEYLMWTSAYTKIAAVLFICAKQFGEQTGLSVTLRIPLTHRDIATLVGLTRETTSLELKKLESKGIICRKNKLVSIPDMRALKKESLLEDQEGLLVNNFL